MIRITVENGVATVTESTRINEEIIITDLDSKEEDYYNGVNFWQRLNLENEMAENSGFACGDGGIQRK